MDYLFCVRCHSGLESQILVRGNQIDEGFLFCPKCHLRFPIICKVPILWDGFASYLSNRPRLGGELFVAAKTGKMRSFIKEKLAEVRKNPRDISDIEKRWCSIYKTNVGSKFYSKIKSMLNPHGGGFALEHGCSIGRMTEHLAKNSDLAFGIDKSFYAIREAKKSKQKNLDFFVADSLEQPFGALKFGVVLALNLFEIVEPKPLLRLLAGQLAKNGTLVLSDPYDFERGQKSVKEPVDAVSLRGELRKYGLSISKNTAKASFVPWNLELNDRASLNYLVDVVFARARK